MVSSSSKGSKSGALDAFWDTIGGSSSTTPGKLSDLFQSLSKSGAIEPAQPADVPGPAVPAQAKDIVLILIKALLAAGQNGWTVAEISQRNVIPPGLALTAIQEAAKFGLVAENNADPEHKRFRLTASGVDLAQTLPQ